jgi:hypothetical protein
MGRWWVFYADWQMECCGTPFSVGDEVSWPLLLMDSDDVLGGGWYDELSKLSSLAEVVRDEDGGVITTLRTDDGLTAALNEDPVVRSDTDSEQWIRMVGLLTVQRHGGEWPETTGTVRSIHVVHQEFAEPSPGSHTLEPVPASRRLQSVDSCPKWFGERPSGVLAELDVPDPRT